MKLPRIETMHFEPMKGSNISDAMRDAIGLSVEHQCMVEFGFNDRWYKVRYESLIEQVRAEETP